MEEDIQNYTPTVMFRGTHCTSKTKRFGPYSTIFEFTDLFFQKIMLSRFNCSLIHSLIVKGPNC